MDEINLNNLKLAFAKTCDYRNTHFSKGEAMNLLEKILTNEQVIQRWKNYAKKNSFASGIAFDEVLASCKEFAEIVFE